MVKNPSKVMSVYSDVIMSLVADAASSIEGVEVLGASPQKKRRARRGGISVYFLPNEKVTIDLFVNVHYGNNVPDIIWRVQEKIKQEVEMSTKYKVHSVNVQIVSIIFPNAG